MDWSTCIFCQKSTREQLQHPVTGKRGDAGSGYQTISKNIQRFNELGCLPIALDSALLGETNAVEELLIQHEAKWHKGCCNKFNNMKLQRAEKRKSCDTGDAQSTSKLTRRSSGGAMDTSTEKCIFCSMESGVFHRASSFNTDQHIRQCALDLEDSVLLGKLIGAGGDVMSQDVLYHAQCLAEYYRKAKNAATEIIPETKDQQLYGIALAELVAYIEESRAESDSVSVFKLVDLVNLYSSRLKQLGVETPDRVHSTHLKNRILSHFPDMQAHPEGRDVLLVFNTDIGAALREASKNDFDNEALILKQASNIVRRELFDKNSVFAGTFENNCQDSSVPPSLKTLVEMILGGPNIRNRAANSVSAQAILTVSQLIQFNVMHRRRDNATGTYHTVDREPPLPVYLGLLIHAETRKRNLVEKFHNLGISVSYDRVLSLSTEMGNNICARFEAENVVCPLKLRMGLFTTSAVDNIDHNPSSTTAQGSFHGTGISLFQHPSVDNRGEDRDDVEHVTSSRKTIAPLPESYSIVPPVVLPGTEPVIPCVPEPPTGSTELFPDAIATEYRWLEHVTRETDMESSQDMKTSWAAFHADGMQMDPDLPLHVSSLLPLFEEQAKSAAMIRHSMDVVRSAVNFLNPGQVPVLACDQPLYALAKQIQWHFPDTYGEKRLVVMFGGLHIELAVLKTIGDWLKGSGWTSAVEQSNLASAGTADSFLKASHISRTRHAHQVTASALYRLMKGAYNQFINTLDQGTDLPTFDAWRAQREAEAPQFQFWSITMDLELALLIFVRSLREGNFALYRESLAKLVSWFFALDHPNYARWIPVHLRDMMSLSSLHPSVEAEFQKGNFVVQKTHRSFSAIPIDQAHEQNNKCVKGDGGAVGLMENSSQLLRWMVAGPEIARVITEFETSQESLRYTETSAPDTRHHEQVKGVQTNFRKQVQSLCDTMEEMGNPFMETSRDLLVLDTHDIVASEVADTVRQIRRVGKEQYGQFVTERLEKLTKPLSDPIKRNKLPLFSCPPVRTVSNDKRQIASLKQNCSLFSQLYVSCQVRDGDLDEFFRHENQSCPPSLSQNGQLRHGTKSDLLHCLTDVSTIAASDTPVVDALLLDGAVIVNILKPGASSTFKEYADKVFLPYLSRQLRCVKRLDIVWDEYLPDSLKATARSQRGIGVRRRVQPDTRLPGNWEAFLRNDENKTELFGYLAEQSVTIECRQDQQVLSTSGKTVLCSRQADDLSSISPCNHEEADTRLLLHAADAVQKGLKKVMIRTVDTDVVVLAVAVCHQIEVEELWICFGTGKNLRYIAAHGIADALGATKSKSLLGFHALTGCDQTSSFASKGKKTAWGTWAVFGEVTPAFSALSEVPTEESIQNVLPLLEHFVVLMYDRTSTSTALDDARKELFSRKGRSIDLIPPTSAAFLQHAKRSAYQAGHIWGQTLVPSPVLPSPDCWGWMKGHSQLWEPRWSTLPQASKCCLEFLKCGCSEKGCRGRCKCVKAEVLCTALCKCGGECDRV